MHFLPPCGLHFNCFFVSRRKSERQDDRTTTRWSWTETAANTSRCFYRLGRSKPPLPTTDLPCLYGLLGPGNGFGATSCPVNKDSKTLPLAFPSLQYYSHHGNSSPGIGISSVWARLLFDRYQIPKGGTRLVNALETRSFVPIFGHIHSPTQVFLLMGCSTLGLSFCAESRPKTFSLHILRAPMWVYVCSYI